ncbi:MAG: hypothetical protein MK085_11240 [Phycisphaerales bacterium]|nr:hypothetical protein [Phycisphaerales bacterium]
MTSFILSIGIAVLSVATCVQDAAKALPVPDGIRSQFKLSPFYRRCVLAGPFPVVSSDKVHPEALHEAVFLINRMVGHRPELLQALADSGTRFVVMSPTEMTTNVPEHSDLEPAGYWDKRARGLGATPRRPAVSCGEENLLCFEGDPYAAENILIHEFAHAVHEMALNRVDATFDPRLEKAYLTGLADGLWEGTYAATNHREYWAEIVQSYFDTNRSDDRLHNHVDTREELEVYDPRGFALCLEVFGKDAWRYRRPFEREPGSIGTSHLENWDRAVAPRFAWPPEVIEAWDRHQAGTLKLR